MSRYRLMPAQTSCRSSVQRLAIIKYVGCPSFNGQGVGIARFDLARQLRRFGWLMGYVRNLSIKKTKYPSENIRGQFHVQYEKFLAFSIALFHS